ncbi:NAD(P)-dependent oxidoreductase [Pseudoxanthomonas sp.]|uniref:SDR family oxidoreductase n=1 Tax=Pseudoxanthomonas sp. TaxID=1871049 RepID=UPI002609F877|nr:NAD(P)-dependent oxidoreductase [Pseudoxanthomonas sp.]WDS36936.1 MAG: NAD(P)-dependent oxidoreductase [Pseudoxanthomonas sp.]
MAHSLRGKTLFITGASRGVGKAIALRAARDGANVIVAAKTAEPDPRLPGTIHDAAREIEQAGGKALAVVMDVRNDEQVAAAVQQAVQAFGGIDILVNNAAAIAHTRTVETPMKRYDLMMDITVRGAYLCSQLCIPHLKQAANPHILMISPPLELRPEWFGQHVAYTMSKYSVSLLALGMANELAGAGIAVNALWPRTVIATAALKRLDPSLGIRGRLPEIMADAAHHILSSDAKTMTGRFVLDEQVLGEAGTEDFAPYLATPGQDPDIDYFVEGWKMDAHG